MKIGATMVARKAAVLVLIVLAVSGMASAGVVISNTLNGYAYFRHTDSFELSWVTTLGAGPDWTGVSALTGSPDASWLDLRAGTTYGVGVSFVNPNYDGPEYNVRGTVTVYTDLVIANDDTSELTVYMWYGSWQKVDPNAIAITGGYTFTSDTYLVSPGDGPITMWLKFTVEDIIDHPDTYFELHAYIETA